jgi:hypothetical protein
MAALAESLVDEWLNRQGFFTVRGVRHGVDEIDLLAVRPSASGLDAWHVEVQASFRPIGYISPLLAEHIPSFAKSKTSAKSRPLELLEPCVESWVEGKFYSASKRAARELAWPGLQWRPTLVHAVVREPAELRLISARGIACLALHTVLADLKHAAGKLKGVAGTDLAEIIEYYNTFVVPANKSLERSRDR